MVKTIFLHVILVLFMRGSEGYRRFTLTGIVSRGSSSQLASTVLPVEKYTETPDFNIRPSITDKARTVTHVCNSGTLCTVVTTSTTDNLNAPFGSYVDYILDKNGWPILLLSGQSLHTQNIRENPSVSLFCQLPRSHAQPSVSGGGPSSYSFSLSSTPSAALSRVTVMGRVSPIPLESEDLSSLKLAFILAHPYSEQIVDSPRFAFYRIKPEKIYFSGGFGVQSTWVDVEEYERARPDVLAQEVPGVLARVNQEKQGELLLICKHFLGIDPAIVSVVRVQAVDRLGIDLRIKTGEYTDEYRVGFRYQVNSAEDAKSEMVKLFQEAWERENGYFFTDNLPPYTKYAEDILRSDSSKGSAKPAAL